MQNWINEIKQKFEPQIIPELDVIKVNSKQLVIIKVDEYPVKPVSLQGRYYQRHNNSNHLLSLGKIAELHLQSLQLSWDSYEFANKTLDDLDDHKIDKLIAEAFYLKGEIENYGTGFMRIKDYLKDYPEILFNFKEVHNGIMVTYEKTAQKTTRDQILELLIQNPNFTKEDLMQFL